MSKPTRPDVFYVDKRNVADYLTNPEWEDAYVMAESYAELEAENAELRDALLDIKHSFAKGPGQRFGLADARAIAHAALKETK